MTRMNAYFLAATGWLFAFLWVSFSMTLQAPSVRPAPAPPQCTTFPAAVLTWFSTYREADIPVGVCMTGPDDRAVPVEIACALPRAYRADNGSHCDITYATYEHLNSYEAGREAEAAVLQLREGALVFQKTVEMRDIFNQRREALLRQDGYTYYAAHGEPTRLVFAPKQGCRIEKQFEARSKPPVWIMMHADANSPFVARAKAYAEKHSYGFLVPTASCTIEGLPVSWLKIALLRHAMLQETPGADDDGWILWLDPMALITNTSVRAESFVSSAAGQQVLLAVGADAQPPVLANVGVMLARKSHAGAQLLDTVWRAGVMKGYDKEDAYYWDQNAVAYLLGRSMNKREFAYWLRSMRVLPHRSLSSFMRQGQQRDLSLGHWRRGDFIALMTGVLRSDAMTQAAMLLRDEADKVPADAPHYWLSHNTHYEFPNNPWVPFMYSSPLDTFFPLSQPTYLSFPNRTPNTRRATPINPTCLWASPEETSVFCVVRTINYFLNLETGHYDWPERGNSVNLFFTLTTKELYGSPGQTVVVPEPKEMVVPLAIESKLFRTNTEGFEDMKLIRHGGQTYGVCTNLQMHPKGNCEIVMVSLQEHRMTEAVPLRGFKPNDCHKNWMAFELDTTLYFVETVDPLTIVKPALPSGATVPVYADSASRYSGLRLRGTSAALPFHKGHLFVVHETVSRGQEYASRFMYLEGGLQAQFPVRKLSKPFFIVRKTVEFLIGLLMPKDKKTIILCFGFEDAVPAFATLTIESPEQFLQHPYFWMH